eukprot:gene54087-53913_t
MRGRRGGGRAGEQLHRAAADGNGPLLRRLLAQRAAWVHVRASDGSTALHAALRHGQYDAAHALLDANADPSVRTQEQTDQERGTIALHAAAKA